MTSFGLSDDTSGRVAVSFLKCFSSMPAFGRSARTIRLYWTILDVSGGMVMGAGGRAGRRLMAKTEAETLGLLL